MYDGYKKILDYVYSTQNVYVRSKLFLSNYGNHRAENLIRKMISINDFVSLIKLIFFCGIIGKGRFYFRKLMIWTFLRNRKNVFHAFLFGALLFQFEKLHYRFMRTYNDILYEGVKCRSDIRREDKGMRVYDMEV